MQVYVLCAEDDSDSEEVEQTHEEVTKENQETTVTIGEAGIHYMLYLVVCFIKL